ncbi:MAG: DinB family protein [Mycetocola sp.]
MTSDATQTLRRYLQTARESMLWKLEGASEYDVRRPLTPTGTNLLGLVKHLAGVEAGYLGDVFGRPYPAPEELPPLDDDAEDNNDMWARADESRDEIIALYRRVWAHGDATISACDLDTEGTVSWWKPGAQRVTLHLVLVHLIAETNRHAGHADIVRELVDGSAGLRDGNSNLPDADARWWAEYRDRLEQTAREAAGI